MLPDGPGTRTCPVGAERSTRARRRLSGRSSESALAGRGTSAPSSRSRLKLRGLRGSHEEICRPAGRRRGSRGTTTRGSSQRLPVRWGPKGTAGCSFPSPPRPVARHGGLACASQNDAQRLHRPGAAVAPAAAALGPETRSRPAQALARQPQVRPVKLANLDLRLEYSRLLDEVAPPPLVLLFRFGSRGFARRASIDRGCLRVGLFGLRREVWGDRVQQLRCDRVLLWIRGLGVEAEPRPR
eukprot:scaffold2022_cov261-Pinguiococcus_pyrenoidosus.AAC.26